MFVNIFSLFIFTVFVLAICNGLVYNNGDITSSISRDKKFVNFDPELVFGYDSERIFYLPDAESLEIYSKLFEPYTNFEIGTP